MNGESTRDDRKDFLGRGFAMPIALDPRTGRVARSEYEDDIRQSIMILLETSPGERVMRPSFGCGIHDLVFTAVDSTAIQRIRSVVEETLVRYEARIEVVSVGVDDSASTGGVLMVELEYRVRRTNQLGNLVFPFYFRDGGRP
jgi:phage baseplate assembly protein W